MVVHDTTPEEQPLVEEEVQEQTQEEEVQIEQNHEEQESEEPQKEKPKKSLDERLKELSHKTWEMRETERRVKEEREKLAELQKNFQDIKPPNPDDFDDVDQFNLKKAQYDQQIIDQKAEEMAQKKFQKFQKEQAENEFYRNWQAEKIKATEKDPNFITYENKVERVLNIYDRLPYAQMILQSDKAADVITYFGKNDDHLDRFASLPPEKAHKEIAVLEYKLGQKPIKKTTLPPEPISSVEGGTSASKDPSKMSFIEFEKYMNKKQYGY